MKDAEGISEDSLLVETSATKEAHDADIEIHPQAPRFRGDNIQLHDLHNSPEEDIESEDEAANPSLLLHDVEIGVGSRPDVGRSANSTTKRWVSRAFDLLCRTFSDTRHLPARTRQLGFYKVVRVIFNYPEPVLELRSTAWLDGLRGLAAFEVFVFHYEDGWINHLKAWPARPDMPLQWYSNQWYYAPVIRAFWASGDAAVCLFFAISGYVLSYRMLQLAQEQRYDQLMSSLSSAIFRRAMRLYIPVLVETFTLMLLCRWLNLPKPGPYESAPTLWLEIQTWLQSFIQLLLPLRYPDRWDKLTDRYDGGISWTIPLEYYGSLYVYASVLFLSRVPSIIVRRCLTAAMVAQSLVKDDWIAAQFLMGMTFADYQIGIERRFKHQPPSHAPPTWRRWMRPVFFICLFLFGFYLSGLAPSHGTQEYEGDIRVAPRPYFDWITRPLGWIGIYHNRQGDRYILCFATMFSLIGIGETPRLRRVLETRPVQYLGRISFGLYLCHVFVRAWLAWLPPRCRALVGLDPNAYYDSRPVSDNGMLFTAYLLTMIPATMVNLVVAGLFERWLDKPSVNAGKRFEKFCLSRGESKAYYRYDELGEMQVPMQEVSIARD